MLSQVKKQTTMFSSPLSLPFPVQCCFLGQGQFPGNEQLPNEHYQGGGGKGEVAVIRRENISLLVFFLSTCVVLNEFCP